MPKLPLPLLGALLALALPATAASQDLLLSELCDPRVNYLEDRFIEFYNAGAAPVDLTGWSVVAIGNGGDIFTWNLSGSIAPGEALVCGDLSTVDNFQVDFADEAWSLNNSTWNGKVGDGARLVAPGSIVVDEVVAPGTLFENDDLVRDPSVGTGSASYVAAQWSATSVDLASEGSPGTHVGPSGSSGPTVANVSFSPDPPTDGDSVDVEADLGGGSANLSGGLVRWGLGSGNLDQQQAMSLVSGSLWRTTSPLPAQPAGTIVYFVVEATSDAPDTTQSPEQSYEVVDLGPPPGYYDSAAGYSGAALRQRLHEIIDDHASYTYDFLWTAFADTDDKPNGKVWDMYSDVPGGTPPYEYDFFVDQGGAGAAEGEGYTREHSWPRSWYGGAIAPMNTDMHVVIPADNRVNNFRSNNPYGETSAPDWTSLNGSERGPSSVAGYGGTVFEPLDAFKGDLARMQLYMTVRYHTEDGGWPGSDATSGADLLPWARDLMLQWHAADPVSDKELERNAAVFAYQNNRNPFIDHPEWAPLLFADGTSAPARPLPILAQNHPNPFNPRTAIRYELPGPATVELVVLDLAGRRVATLLPPQPQPAGSHQVWWDGRSANGAPVASGVYLYRLRSAGEVQQRAMVLLK